MSVLLNYLNFSYFNNFSCKNISYITIFFTISITKKSKKHKEKIFIFEIGAIIVICITLISIMKNKKKGSVMIKPIEPTDEIIEIPVPKPEVIEKTGHFFGSESPLKHHSEKIDLKYEPRKEQIEMAYYVSEALENNHNLCVEAPTGVGKSFAYLVPAIFFAKSTHKPVIVSTETISLQEQLIQKDLPLLQELFDFEFDAVLAKGRSNYLCKRRLSLAVGDFSNNFLPMEILKTQAEEIAEQASGMQQCTKSDFNMEIDNRTWDSVCCELGNCKGPKCVFFRSCFYWQERKKWDKADIIVANHALLFTDLKLKSMQDSDTSLLPAYGALIFDEAHTLEDCAANHLGIKISKSGFTYQLNKLFNPKYSNGLLVRSGEMHADVRASAGDVHKSSEKFFSQVKEILNEMKSEEKRIRKPGEIKDSITISLNKLQHELRNLIKFEDDEDYKQELTSILQKISGYHSDFFDFLNMEHDNFVYWIEKKGVSDNIFLNAAPVKVDIILQDMLFNSDFPVILTSATLSVNNSMKYYRERVGYTNGPEITLGSPFNYQKQVKLYTTRKIPLPGDKNYEEELIKHTEHFIRKTHGKAFVLFTSYYLLKKAAEELREPLAKEGITIYVQGEGLSRTSMLNEFRKDINSVLFGTSSFWMGVDVPGESLSNVIITKLPFAVPSHPLIQARAEKVEETGKSSFMHYSLPEAVLKFKQGIGRLIRSKDDKGIIVILDSRIVTKHYGKMFLNSIPQSPVVTYSDLTEIQ